MSTINLNRERLELLRAIGRGSVHTSLSGHLMVRPRGRGQNRRCDAKVRELQLAELVDEALVDGKPQLTGFGRDVVDGAR